jgi:xanthine dehydrogenase accessory factor
VTGEGVIVIKGAGDMATGAALRLHRAGLRLMMTEIAAPTVVRRSVAFAEAVFAGETVVEDVRARRCADLAEAAALDPEIIPVLIDPEAAVVRQLRPTVLVDGIMAKRNLGTCIDDAPVTIALGPGFVAGHDVHAVVETQRGHYLGRMILEGAAEADTGVPGNIGGYTRERVLRAPVAGRLVEPAPIGAQVGPGDTVAWVDGQPVRSAIQGTLRGSGHPPRPTARGDCRLRRHEGRGRGPPGRARALLHGVRQVARGGGRRARSGVLSRAPAVPRAVVQSV